MRRHDFEVSVAFRHRVVFGRGVFAAGQAMVAELLREGGGRRVLALVEAGVAAALPGLCGRIEEYFAGLEFEWQGVRVVAGGEAVKQDDRLVRQVWEWIDACRIDRHSYVLAVGGGAFLDAVGFAAGTAHRGVRLVRFPTTTLSQDDSGVGVKCAINGFGKKNWIGSFGVPWAVVNDFEFLATQDPRMRTAGLIEAIKVAVVKDAGFFEWIEAHVAALAGGETVALEECVERSAMLHAKHIAEGGDPFETGSSRPLDFGHWAAHKLEQWSEFRLPHAEAVAVGVALDTVYARRAGLLDAEGAARILAAIRGLGMPVWHEGLDARGCDGRRVILAGLEDFREHLGGRLTVLMPVGIGRAVDVHEIDEGWLDGAIEELRSSGGS